MSALVSLSDLCWSTPDGTAVFTDITLSFGAERTGIVGRNGVGKTTLLQLIAGELFPQSGQVRCCGRIAVLRQGDAIQPGETVADLLGVRSALDLLDRAEAGQASAADLMHADWTLPARVAATLDGCGFSVGPRTPLAALSGGQRRRVALAAVLFDGPDMLLLDEPTNNLDAEGADAVRMMLRGWRGGAIIVSHDRALLDEMDAIVELTSLGAARYGGNFTAFRQMKQREIDAALHDLAYAEQVSAQAADRAQQAAERKARKDSAGRKARARGGQPKILLDAAKGRAEASGGAGLRLREARRDAAAQALVEAARRVEIVQPLRMTVPSSGLAAGVTVLRLDRMSGGYDPRNPIIRDMSLTITGPERIALSGPNGCGKTTLIRLICGDLAPFSGRIERRGRIALLDQHLAGLDAADTLAGNFRRLNPQVDMQTAHAALARFGFRGADATRRAGALSGGERLRAGLACVLGAVPPPQLLILDEPTNHLDLDGIAALEAALVAYDGALLVVSHNPGFVDQIGVHRTLRLVGG